MKNTIFILCFCLIVTSTFAQQIQRFECGTPPGSTIERLTKNLAAAEKMPKNNGIQYLPVTMTLIANTDGSSRIDEELALDGFCALNENFESIGIQFYLKDGLRYVDNSAYYLINGPNSANPANLKVANTINIFVAEVLTGGTGASCSGVLGFYSPSFDYVAIDKCTVDSESFALTHELGHFFSLPHTFLGWESVDYDNTEPTPTFVSGVAVEYADGRNCSTAADRICDTPPDYGFGLGWSTCDYSLEAFDPDGEPVDPDEMNYMGYFFNCDEHTFSPNQGDVMAADIASRSFVSGTPNATIISEAVNLLSPINNEITPPQNTVLTWSPVTGAEYYLVEVNRLPSFSPSFTTEKIIVNTESLTLNDLVPNVNYYWRIRPFSEYYTCTDYSESGSFRTDEAIGVETIKGVESLEIYPNPSNGQPSIYLEINSLRRFEADVNLFDTQGKRVFSATANVETGMNQIQISTELLAQGAYILALQSKQGVMHQRIVITE